MTPDWVDWSARLAVGLYLLALLADGRRLLWRSTRAGAILWTLGWIVFVVHVYAAFELVHDWSHQKALQHTADQTELQTGIRSGGGLYLNYLFLVLWTLDVVRVWVDQTRAWLRVALQWRWLVHCVFAFMMLNATVIFGPPGWIALAAFFVLVLALRLRFDRRLQPIRRASYGA